METKTLKYFFKYKKKFLKGLYSSLNLKGINLKFILKKNYIHFFLGFSHFIIISRIKNIHIFSKKKNLSFFTTNLENISQNIYFIKKLNRIKNYNFYEFDSLTGAVTSKKVSEVYFI